MAAGLAWAGNHILSDSDAYAVANLMRLAAGESIQSANDGCSGNTGGNNAFAMNGGGICARQSKTATSADTPCSPWNNYNGTDWHIFARCN
ncbi:MAG: hypothetical protein Alpg2KO_33410 [Alphaproteobacteria bacterium]